MHLCANVVLGLLLPAGTIVRRNFSFAPGEKSGWNRWYRQRVDAALSRRHRLTDFLYSIQPAEPQPSRRIVQVAARSAVELETHPVRPDEYRLLAGGAFNDLTGGVVIRSASSAVPGQSKKRSPMKVCDRAIRVDGRIVKIGRLDADRYQFVEDVPSTIEGLRACGRRIDIFTFLQPLADASPRYSYPMEWDNLAVLPVSTFDHWMTEQIRFKVRNKVKKALKSGITTREWRSTTPSSAGSMPSTTNARCGRAGASGTTARTLTPSGA